MSRRSKLEEGLDESAGRGRRTARKFNVIDGGADQPVEPTDEPQVAVEDTAIAEAVDVLTEAIEEPQVEEPTVTAVVEDAAPAEPPVIMEASPAESAIELARKLTHRQRHGNQKPTRVTIACPKALFERIDKVSDKMGNDERIGRGLTPLNKGSLMTEAARRFAANPTAYPVVFDDEFTANPPLHGGVSDDIWTDMKSKWWDLEDRSPNFGQHVAAALDEIVTELESLYPPE